VPQPRMCRAARPQPPRLAHSSFPAQSHGVRNMPTAEPRRGPRSLSWGRAAVLLLIGGGVAHAVPVAAEPHNVATSVDAFADIVAEASQRFGIPALWIRAVMQVESFGDVHALSPKGAMGLMQLMPEAWAALRSRYQLGADPYDPHNNILAGAAYLRELHDSYGSPGFLAAYNAGPARYEDHLATGRPLPAETRAYVAALAPLIGGASVGSTMIVTAAVSSWIEAPLFVVRAESSTTKSPVSSDLRPSQRSTDKSADDWTGLAPQSHGLFVRMSHGIRRP